MRNIKLIMMVILLISCTKESNKVENGGDLFIKEQIVKIDKVIDAPSFTLESIDGGEVSLSDYKGKVLFINFWASWCGPCVYEMPAIARLHSSFASDDEVEILLINLGEDRSTVENFLKDGGYSIPTLLDRDNSVGLSYGVRSIPTTVILDKSGRLVGTKIGAHEWDSDGVKEILNSLK